MSNRHAPSWHAELQPAAQFVFGRTGCNHRDHNPRSDNLLQRRWLDTYNKLHCVHDTGHRILNENDPSDSYCRRLWKQRIGVSGIYDHSEACSDSDLHAASRILLDITDCGDSDHNARCNSLLYSRWLDAYHKLDGV